MSKATWNLVLPISTLIANATTGEDVTYDDLIEETMTIIRSCSMLESKDTLLLAGEYEEILQRSSLRSIPVALIGESKSSAFELFTLSRYSFTVFTQFPLMHLLCKLNQFVVVASSQPLLRLLLQRIKDSTWANFNGFHVLIDRRTEERGCVNAYKFLWAASEYDLLSVIFLCIDPADGLAAYTYNPYSTDAPSIWGKAGEFRGRGGHPWTLLKRKHQGTKRDWMCEDFTFDKTTNLNGYEVRLNAISFSPHLRINHRRQGVEKFTGDNSEIVRLLFKKLNATVNVTVYNGTAYDLGGVGSHGNMEGMLADVGSGKVDMGMNVRSLHAMWKAHLPPRRRWPLRDHPAIRRDIRVREASVVHVARGDPRKRGGLLHRPVGAHQVPGLPTSQLGHHPPDHFGVHASTAAALSRQDLLQPGIPVVSCNRRADTESLGLSAHRARLLAQHQHLGGPQEVQLRDLWVDVLRARDQRPRDKVALPESHLSPVQASRPRVQDHRVPGRLPPPVRGDEERAAPSLQVDTAERAGVRDAGELAAVQQGVEGDTQRGGSWPGQHVEGAEPQEDVPGSQAAEGERQKELQNLGDQAHHLQLRHTRDWVLLRGRGICL
ncbi:uncharacterized protein LOC143373326 isoform X2 [Andrena cerasifolii]|uniref:uncharacterized protein LOC143373326 isoform X2 n=1 Tax=Andrena cerasifolii TaxID=2819439 RepID=UPI0040383DB9